MISLWGLRAEGAVVPFSADADALLRDFERWLEPQLGPEGDLASLGGWANKLAGACARVAGIFHLIANGGAGAGLPVAPETVEAAIALGQHYFLPHAMAAFHVMGADQDEDQANHVWRKIRGLAEREALPPGEAACLTHRDIYRACRTRTRFRRAEEIDPVIDRLERLFYIAPAGHTAEASRRGVPSPEYLVNPLALAVPEPSAMSATSDNPTIRPFQSPTPPPETARMADMADMANGVPSATDGDEEEITL